MVILWFAKNRLTKYNGPVQWCKSNWQLSSFTLSLSSKNHLCHSKNVPMRQALIMVSLCRRFLQLHKKTHVNSFSLASDRLMYTCHIWTHAEFNLLLQWQVRVCSETRLSLSSSTLDSQIIRSVFFFFLDHIELI